MQDFLKSDAIRELKGWVFSLMTAVIAALLIRAFIIETVLVEGSSMRPTLNNNERVILYKTGYLLGTPRRGDIIVFRTPKDQRVNYVKRVIGLPGETVRITDGTVYVNGVPLTENYILAPPMQDYDELKIPEGMYFVLGDNRNNSKDSRDGEVGLIPGKNIKGKAIFRIWPINKISIIR
ncbi:MAG TPA: signal peptidase I [Candidatus Atribacteria bacterium]|nr:signal peptidase I [Candidatus Atribacteria bacterium]HPT77829.1 signal peptidase I [Candidatus Atribacteria bacterium]